MLSLPQFSNMVVHNAILLETVLPAIAKVHIISMLKSFSCFFLAVLSKHLSNTIFKACIST